MDVSYGILSSHFFALDFGEINKDFVIKWVKIIPFTSSTNYRYN